MSHDSANENRRVLVDRRRHPRVRRCENCQAHLVVDRRGPTVLLYSAAGYLPAAARTTCPSAAPLMCPICGAALRPK
jgi:hypothetical protein